MKEKMRKIIIFLIGIAVIISASVALDNKKGGNMFSFFKNLFSKKDAKESFTDETYDKHYEAKQKALEKILGKMHNLVGHALIPFDVGGTVDMYYFPNATQGTAFVTMELIQPDGTGPKPNRMGTYELIAFTKHEIPINIEDDNHPFNKIQGRVCTIFTAVGNYSFEEKLEPGETCELPADEGEEAIYLIFDEYKKDGVEFRIDGKKHGLLLCIEIFRSEMLYAMENGSANLFAMLKKHGYYPYSDLDRQPVVNR